MGAAGRNIVKVVTGSALAAGIGALVSKAIERSQAEPEVSGAVPSEQPEQSASVRDRLRSRWEQARNAGEQARLAREAELKTYFREKVNDPAAFQRDGSETG